MPQTSVAVFFGGNSNEHEISVITGMLAANLLRAANFRVYPVFLPRTGGMMFSERMRSVEDLKGDVRFPRVRLEGSALVRERGRRRTPFDVALNCCHGGMGEDGTLAALFSWHGVRTASPNAALSAVFMNKRLTKIAAAGMGLPVLPSFCVKEGVWNTAKEPIFASAEELGYPVVVKPCRLGSSIGVSVAKTQKELEEGLALAFRLDDDALVEKYLIGKRDVNCAACRLGGKLTLSPLEEVFSASDVLTFGEKYEERGARSALPADLPAPAAESIERSMRVLFENFDLCGVVRADFLVSGETAYFNELNTVPGSLAAYLFGGTLSECKKFLVSLIEEALRSPLPHKEVLRTDILAAGVFSRGKSCKHPHF